MGLISNGTTIFDNGTVNAGGSLNFISKATASSSASIEFTSGIDSTYKEYVFYFHSIHPQNDDASLSVTFSTDGGSTYGLTKTSTYFRAYHNESDTDTALAYLGSKDLAQSTAIQQLAQGIGNDNDQCTAGYLHIFNPSSTTFIKHYISRFNTYEGANYSMDQYCAGYINDTTAVNSIKFQMSSGNIDAGEILLFGVN
jgi:hypothetical protein